MSLQRVAGWPYPIWMQPISNAQNNILPAATKKRRRKRKESFSIYIIKVLNQVHPETTIDLEAKKVMNSFCIDMFERIAAAASRLVHNSKRSTLTADDIKAALGLVLNGALMRHAESEGNKAISKFKESQNKK